MSREGHGPTRKWKRVKVDKRVRLRRWDEPEESSIVVRTYELSEGGMSVYAPEALVVGSQVYVEFWLAAEHETLKVRGVVRNRRGFRCGIEFLYLKAAETESIRHYLQTVKDVAV